MFEGLAQIDWSKLTHAYGSAEDVPGLLKDLMASDAKVREKAIYALHGNIWHQGTVYEATVAAVPFLIELVSSPTVSDRDQILMLLSALANGNSYCEVHQHLSLLKERSATEEWQTQMAKELEWVRAVQVAVLKGRSIYLDFLKHGDTKVREAAGFLLATLEQPSPETAAALWEQLEREAGERCRLRF